MFLTPALAVIRVTTVSDTMAGVKMLVRRTRGGVRETSHEERHSQLSADLGEAN